MERGFGGGRELLLRRGDPLSHAHRRPAAVYFVADHLGSTNKLVDPYGAPLTGERQLYMPWGESRSSSLSLTRYQYTGQAWDSSVGLYYYQARWYDNYLNLWTSPDTDVPDPCQPWEWNLYTYSRNNPILFTDPSGFLPLLMFERDERELVRGRKVIKANYWNNQEKIAAERAAFDVGLALAKTINANNDLLYAAIGLKIDDCALPPIKPVSANLAFQLVYKGPVTFKHVPIWSGSEVDRGSFAQTQGRNLVNVFKDYTENYAVEHPGWVIHELGHAFEQALSPGKPWNSPGNTGLSIDLLTRASKDINDSYAGFAGGFGSWQYSKQTTRGEIFVDMFLGWVYDTWAIDPQGHLTQMAQSRADHMNQNMADLIRAALSR